jgi:hypothetical protein
MTLTPQERAAFDSQGDSRFVDPDITTVVNAMFNAGHEEAERLGIKTSGDDRMAKVEANIILWLRNS